MDIHTFIDRCAALADRITDRQRAIHDLLASYETAETIDHEIQSSIEALRGVAVEYEGFEQPEHRVTACCFMPVNLPLYSLVLYAVLPGYYFETMYLRPGVSLSPFIASLIKELGLDDLGFDYIKVKDLPAKLFVDLYAKDSEVILFTGKYENALMLERECPDGMLVFEGTGPCPFLVFADADLDRAAKSLVSMRCFNSGQDCVAPDVVYVDATVTDAFSDKVIQLLKHVKVGSSLDPEVRVASAIKEKYLLKVQEWLEKNHESIIYGGEIDAKDLVVHPAVLRKTVSEHKGAYLELFAPIFYLLSFSDTEELIAAITTPAFVERSMYASVFGANKKIESHLKLCTILRDTNVNDQENGNKPYGGYGQFANFVSYQGQRTAAPLLISRDVREWILAQQDNGLAQRPLEVSQT